MEYMNNAIEVMLWLTTSTLLDSSERIGNVLIHIWLTLRKLIHHRMTPFHHFLHTPETHHTRANDIAA